MKKIMSIILTVILLVSGIALAEQAQTVPELNYVENVTYWGDGVFKIELMRNVAWRTDYALTAKDAFNVPQSAEVLGGDANDVYVRLTGEVNEDALYFFSLVSDGGIIGAQGVATVGIKHHNYCEYCLAFGHGAADCAQRIADGVKGDIDRCDLCGELGHEDDRCPNRVQGVLYCDECGQSGHDDDYCPYDNDENDDWDEWCDNCGQLGHDDDRCPNRRTAAAVNTSSANDSSTVRREYCDECRQYGHDDHNCPNERCDECGKLGHDDDNCPNERCDECGKLGHDDDNCPNERCDECGKLGHDDDNCPNERCDECGKLGHDDDHCPYDRD